MCCWYVKEGFNVLLKVGVVLWPPGLPWYNRVKEKLRKYGETCKMDVYLHLCEQDYVGEDSMDKTLNAQEVCRKINDIKQEWKDSGGRWQRSTPDEIFNSYLLSRRFYCKHLKF